MKIRKIIVPIYLLIAVFIFSACSPSVVSVTGDELIHGENTNLLVQGNVEAKEIDINTKVAGKISDIKVKEGDKIKAGDVLVVIDSNTLLAKKEQTQALIMAAEGQVKAAEAAKQAAMAQLQKAENGARKQELEQLKVGYELAEKTFKRVELLYQSKGCPTSQYDEAKTKYEVSKQQYEMALEGAREEDILAAKAVVAQAESTIQAAKGKVLEAKGGFDEVNTYIEDTAIRASMDGTITSLNMEVGELVTTGMPILTISNLDSQWIEVNVKETDLSMVKLNDEVAVTLPAYKGEKFKGKIVRVNEKPDFATKRATNNNGEYDVLSFGVKIELDNVEKTIYPGMTAIVDFGKRVEN